MSPLWIGIALIVVVDVIVVYFVFKRVMARKAALGGGGFSNIASFAGTAAEESKAYFAANYGGDPAMLPTALQGLVNRLAQTAQERGAAIDRESLKQFAAGAAVSLRVAKSDEVRKALQSVS